MFPIKVMKLDPAAKIPTYATPGDAGADLYALVGFMLFPQERYLAPTGIALEIPLGYVGLVHPRSGLANKHGITVMNAPGTIDAGYRGEIKVNLVNFGSYPVPIQAGDRIAQILFQQVESAGFVEVTELSASNRGSNGHGSSGVN